MAAKPPLPPRAPSNVPSSDRDSNNPQVHSPDAYTRRYLSPTSGSAGESPYLAGVRDPRSSSTQSLGPVKSVSDGRRTLLIIYIHGFLGDETSFKSFPAHVHGLLTPALAETHVVYTKIYPRYKSRQNVAVARDALSNWLAAHESDSTDIILIGHSLGGILGAEVVLIPSTEPGSYFPRHQILGLIAFDTPFLGMHPGVVGTGIASLFRTPPQLKESALLEPSPFPDLFSSPPDPTYNPSYANDVRLANRKGKLQRALYFWNKHAGELAKAARDYVSSHLEFGGCLADYPGLRKRYSAIRALEDVEEIMQPRAPNGRLMKRVRFVNYYSASTGPVKERPPDPLGDAATHLGIPPSRASSDGSTHSSPGPKSASPRLSYEGCRDDELPPEAFAGLNVDDGTPKIPSSYLTAENVTPLPAADQGQGEEADTGGGIASQRVGDRQPRDSMFEDGGASHTTSREQNAALGVPADFSKVTDNSTQELEQLLQKRADGVKQEETEDPPANRQQLDLQILQLEETASMGTEEDDKAWKDTFPSKGDGKKKQKDRKFCALPGKGDKTWIRVHMEGIDEVVAHTSLFNVNETYAKLVGDTVERIENWVAEAASTRLILSEMNNSG